MPRPPTLGRLLGLSCALAGPPAAAEPAWTNLNESEAQLPWPVASVRRVPDRDAFYVILSGNDAALVRTDGRSKETLRWLPPASTYRWLPAHDGGLLFAGEHMDETRVWRRRGGAVELDRVLRDARPRPLVFSAQGLVGYDPLTGAVGAFSWLAPRTETHAVLLEDGSAVFFQPGPEGQIAHGAAPTEQVALPGLGELVPFGGGWLARTADGAVHTGGPEAPPTRWPQPGAVTHLAPGLAANEAVWRRADGRVARVAPDGPTELFRTESAFHRLFAGPGAVVAVTGARHAMQVFFHDGGTSDAREVGPWPDACPLEEGDPARAVFSAGAAWLPCGAGWVRVSADGVGPRTPAAQDVLPFSFGFGLLGSTPHATLEVHDEAAGDAYALDLRRMRNAGSHPQLLGPDVLLARRGFGRILAGEVFGGVTVRAELGDVVFASSEVVMEVDARGHLERRLRAADGAPLDRPGLPPDAILLQPLAGGMLAGAGRRPTHWVPPAGPAVPLASEELPPLTGLWHASERRLAYTVRGRPGVWLVDLDARRVTALPVPGDPIRLAVAADRVVTAGEDGAYLIEARRGAAPARIAERSRILAVDGPVVFLHELDRVATALLRVDGQSGDIERLPPFRPGARRFFPYAGGLLFVDAGTDAAGYEPWFWPGPGREPVALGDLFAGPAGSELRWVKAAGGYAYFTAEHRDEGREYGRTDGTPEGTTWLPLVPGPQNGAPDDFTGDVQAVGEALALAGLHPEDGVELAVLDARREVPDAPNAPDAGPPGELEPGLTARGASCGCRSTARGPPIALVVVAGIALRRRSGRRPG